jgi:hypothetical protein
MIMHDDDLTPDERRAFETLPREQMPGADLEDRVVGALMRRRLLRRRRRVFELTRFRLAAAVAASIAFVVGGFALGQWTTLHQVTTNRTAMIDSSELSAAASVQYAATAYLLALENLAALPDTASTEDARQGREVALSTLYAAAGRVSHMVPKDYLAGQLMSAIDVNEPGGMPPGSRSGAERASKFVWF